MNIVKFSADWCQPCKQLSLTLGKLGLAYTEVDIEKEPELTAKHRIRGVPTLVVFGEDGLEYGRLIGNKSEKEVKSWYESL